MNGPAKFGEVYAYGQIPLANRPGLFDCLVGTYGDVSCEFYVDPTSGEVMIGTNSSNADNPRQRPRSRSGTMRAAAAR